MDPYVIVKVDGQSMKTNVCSGGGKFPKWFLDKPFSFKTNMNSLVLIELWDSDATTDDYIGTGRFKPSSFVGHGNKSMEV